SYPVGEDRISDPAVTELNPDRSSARVPGWYLVVLHNLLSHSRPIDKTNASKPTVQLLIIDPQNDFCDVPASYRPADPLTGTAIAPALPVAGAHADTQRTPA